MGKYQNLLRQYTIQSAEQSLSLLTMEDELSQDNFLWDGEEKSWPFTNLDRGGEGDGGGNSGHGEEVAAAGKGKKRADAARKEDDGGDGKIVIVESDDHELHIWTERERRKKMRNMFNNLHALLPHIPHKADKSTIVDEAIKYIQKLQESLHQLQRRKLDKLRGVMSLSPIVTQQKQLAIQSREAFLAEQGSTTNSTVTLASPNPNPMFTGPDFPAIFKTWSSTNVNLNVCGKDAHISVCCAKKPGLLTAICFVMEKHKLQVVSAQASADYTRCMYMIHARVNGGSDQIQQAFATEEAYKKAVAEIILWVNS